MNWLIYGGLAAAIGYFLLRKSDGPAEPPPGPSAPAANAEFRFGDCIAVNLRTVLLAPHDGGPLDPVVRSGGEEIVCGRVVSVGRVFGNAPGSGSLVVIVELAKPLPGFDVQLPNGSASAMPLTTVSVPQQGIVGVCNMCP